jgi:K+-transporting ATPase c subunit
LSFSRCRSLTFTPATGSEPEDRIRQLVDANTEGRFLGLLGEPRVNVLRLNLALDRLTAG